jgi:hypothetical protein
LHGSSGDQRQPAYLAKTHVDGRSTVSPEFRFVPSGEIAGIYSPGRWGKFADGSTLVPWESHFWRRVRSIRWVA